jgi:PIN domain nuclease of toxin-antitoxin system
MGRAEVILVDTHVVVWLAFDQDRLSKKARAAIDDARQNGDGLAISDITLVELAALFRKGRIRPEISLESFLDEVEARFVVLPISGRACARARTRTSGGLSEGSGRSYDWSDRTGRGDVSAHCGPRDPQGAGGSNNLVSSYSTVTDFARFLG